MFAAYCEAQPNSSNSIVFVAESIPVYPDREQSKLLEFLYV